MKTDKVDYPAILEEAWQQHLAPRAPDAPTVISLFAGCGGSSLGYSMAGYRELLAVEWNDNAVATFKLNFSDVPVYHGDIHELTVEQCLRMTNLQPGELDLLDGSPPCQGFSTAGKREMTDKRNQLYMEFVRLLKELQPKVFVMENVSGLVKGKMKLIFADIMRELKASGYKVRCKLLNAMYFNVPQSRQRLIWIGIRKDMKEDINFPRAESRSIGIQEIIPDARASRSMKINPWIYHPRCAATLTKTHSDWQLRLRNGNIRKPSIDEAKLLCSFSGYFICHSWEQLGNSVPPLFMRAIAGHVKREILSKWHAEPS